jgi:hypothetical protein
VEVDDDVEVDDVEVDLCPAGYLSELGKSILFYPV